jgi:hypothetical protein
MSIRTLETTDEENNKPTTLAEDFYKNAIGQKYNIILQSGQGLEAWKEELPSYFKFSLDSAEQQSLSKEIQRQRIIILCRCVISWL